MNRDNKGKFIKGHTANIGRIFSEERNKKISEALKGHKVSEKVRNRIGKANRGATFNRGRIHTLQSRLNMSEAHKGNYPSEETKKKMSESGKDKIIPKEVRKKLSESNKGKVRSEEARRNNSKAQIGRIAGEKNPNWKGGISPLYEKIRKNFDYKNWRRKIFERDNFTCQMCDKIGGKLRAHHIKSFSEYPELRFDINNGITLCESPCHKTEGLHKKIKKVKALSA